MTYLLDNEFELNGKTYLTDTETLQILRMVVSRAKISGDSSGVIAVMALGEKSGRIKYSGEFQTA